MPPPPGLRWSPKTTSPPRYGVQIWSLQEVKQLIRGRRSPLSKFGQLCLPDNRTAVHNALFTLIWTVVLESSSLDYKGNSDAKGLILYGRSKLRTR